MDLGLPGLNGFEVASRLRQDSDLAAGIALLVALTGYCEEELRQSAQQAGFDHYFVKPVDFDAVLALLASLQGADQARWTEPISVVVPSSDDAAETKPDTSKRRS
jgi:CheY-like chemotaxis protein